MDSVYHLALLQNLYKLQTLGFEYIDHFETSDIYQKPSSLEELQKNISSCHLCDLSKSRTQSMSGYGHKNAKLFFIDASVSQFQDATNDYFAGKSGEILQNMIEKVLQLPLEDIYITHIVKCKPLQTKQPTIPEYETCKSYLFA